MPWQSLPEAQKQEGRNFAAAFQIRGWDTAGNQHGMAVGRAQRDGARTRKARVK